MGFLAKFPQYHILIVIFQKKFCTLDIFSSQDSQILSACDHAALSAGGKCADAVINPRFFQHGKHPWSILHHRHFPARKYPRHICLGQIDAVVSHAAFFHQFMEKSQCFHRPFSAHSVNRFSGGQNPWQDLKCSLFSSDS